MIQILWGYCPPEVREALRPILVDYLWLLPPWCRSLYVAWDDKYADRDAAMYSAAQPEYRQAQLRVCPLWLAAIPQVRRQNVAHELLHIPLVPVVQGHDDLLTRLLDDAPGYQGYAKEQWRLAFEGTVQDLAASVAALSGPFPEVAFVEVDDDDLARDASRRTMPGEGA